MAKRKWTGDEKLGCGIGLIFLVIFAIVLFVLGVGVWAFVEIVQWLTSK